MRENFLEKTLDFNGILTKKSVFDKKVVKNILYIVISCFTPDRAHRTQNALSKFLV